MEQDLPNDSGDQTRVAPRLVKPHPMVRRAGKLYAKPKTGHDCRCAPRGSPTLRLHVAPASVARPLRVANAPFKVAEARGQTTALALGCAGGACITVGGQSLEVSM